MSKGSRSVFLLSLLNFGTLRGCGTAITPTSNFSVVVFSDVHFDPFYDTTLFPQLCSADPGSWEAIFKSSIITKPSAWGFDTNYPLLVLALSGIKQNLGSSPVIIFTGDLLGHSFAPTYYSNCTNGARDQALMQAFAANA